MHGDLAESCQLSLQQKKFCCKLLMQPRCLPLAAALPWCACLVQLPCMEELCFECGECTSYCAGPAGAASGVSRCNRSDRWSALGTGPVRRAKPCHVGIRPADDVLQKAGCRGTRHFGSHTGELRKVWFPKAGSRMSSVGLQMSLRIAVMSLSHLIAAVQEIQLGL